MEGQVTVYTIIGCPHCLHCKQTLKDLKIPYVEVSVDKFPVVREWLKDRTGKSSVPQIFFNNTHIGGNDDLQTIVKDGKIQDLLDILKDKSTLNLLIPTESDTDISDAPSFACIADPSSEVIKDLIDDGIPHSMRLSLFSHKQDNAFSGADFVTWYCQKKDANEAESIECGSELLRKKFITPLTKPSPDMVNDSKIFYRLNECSEIDALNAGPIESCLISDGNQLAEVLRNSILTLYSSFISSDGKVVDYEQMKNSPDFEEYVKLSQLLQRVSVEDMNENERKAFFINLYNAMVIHATTLKGPPKGFVSRFKFFADTNYIIGGLVYSLNDIENGVLRGNKRGVLSICAPFGKHDRRSAVAVPKVDPRIHFALNCGARSCPPIKTFTSKDLNSELQLATESFLEEDDGITLNECEGGTAEVKISSLFRWYSSDFGTSQKEVLEWICTNLSSGKKKTSLETILEKSDYKVSYLPYDWGSNTRD